MEQLQIFDNERHSDDKVKQRIYDYVEVDTIGMIMENKKEWGYSPLTVRDYEDYNQCNSVKMTGYHHPIVHQMPDMAFNFALMQEVKHRTPHRGASPETMCVVGVK